jgi:hypothetical protein
MTVSCLGHGSAPVATRRGRAGSRWLAATAAGVLLTAVGTSAAAAGTLGPAGQPGQHTVTNGPISITVPAAASFKVGTVTAVESFCGFPQPYVWTSANVSFAWSAHSTAGRITGYDIFVNTVESGPQHEAHSTAPRWTDWQGNYDGSCGGGGDPTGWQVHARDSAGHTVVAAINEFLTVVRYDNVNVNVGEFGPQGTWTYTGVWAQSTCGCADGGSQTYTTAKGATATFTVTTTAGQQFGLLMASGPGRGAFTLYQDGVLVATVNTHATANANRVIVWASAALTAGTHVFTVVNKATSGHPRIDVNAALTD